MRGNLKNLVSRVRKGQGGFTLIEMIVVVGIIAVLAAVIIPNMGHFIGVGEQGAKDEEWRWIQSGMDLMIIDKAAPLMTAHDKSTSSNATRVWTSLPVGGAGVTPLEAYLSSATTAYFYCYNTKGTITELFEAPDACTLP